MRVVKQIITTVVCAFLSKFAQAQIFIPDTIRMYTGSEMLYLDSSPFIIPDTLYAENADGGRFEENAFILMTKEKKYYGRLSMCRTRSAPERIKLVRIGKNLFRIGERIVVKIDKKTLYAFVDSFKHARHCDHFSHYSSRL